MAVPFTNRRPILFALAGSFLLTVLIILALRNLEHYDAALFGYTVASIVAFGAVVFGYAMQKFIFRRGFSRWLKHLLIMWGCIISALITFPLVFGWVHFELEGDVAIALTCLDFR